MGESWIVGVSVVDFFESCSIYFSLFASFARPVDSFFKGTSDPQ